MRALWVALGIAAMAFVMPAAPADDDKSKGPAEDFNRTGPSIEKELDSKSIVKQQTEIRTTADTTMQKLFATSPGAKGLYDRAYGYAVFSIVKVAVGITGGGGDGVAYAKRAMNEPIYMEMATGGVGLGLGGQKYQTIFLFENQRAFEDFVYGGWEADAAANAAAGNQGANAAASFSDGVAIYQITDKGLIASVDVAGTKYWVDEDLNSPAIVERAKEKDREKTD
jgi:lipid-binding SYLF domain-containing protein